MKLFLIRHGETVSSGRTYAGRSDVPLTALGREQARRVAERLQTERVTLILCSPLSRAVETARPLARQQGLEPVLDPAMSEIDFGVYEGRNKTSLELSLRKSHSEVPLPGGESLRDVWGRAGEVLGRLRRRPDAVCAVVGHFWINRLLWGRAWGLAFEEACRNRDYRPQTGSCVVLSLADRAAVRPGDISNR